MSTVRRILLFSVLACLVAVSIIPATAADYPKDDPKKAYQIDWYPLFNSDQQDVALVEKAINDYLKKKLPNTTVKLNIMHWGSWWAKMPTLIFSGEKMDIFFTSSWWGPYYDQVVQGALIPLNDLLDKYGKGIKKVLGDGFIKGSQINGINYAVPVAKELATQDGWMFNKKLVDKYKFDLKTIKKPEDIEPWLDIIKKNEPDITPLAWQGNRSFFNHLLFQYIVDDSVPGAVRWDDKKGKIFNQFEDPEYLKYVDIAKTWYKKGFMLPEAATQNSKHAELVDAYRCFAYQQPLKPGKDKEDSKGNKVWVQKELTPIITRTADATGAMHGISVASRNPERVMKFLNLVWTDPYLCNLIVWGIENKHYTKTGANYIKTIPNSGWDMGLPWAMGNQYIQYLQEGEAPDKYTKFQEFNKKGKTTVNSGFYFNQKPYEAEIAAIKAVAGEYLDGIRCGIYDNPREKIEEMLARMEKAGYKKVTAAMQKEFDAFLKQK